MMCSVAPSTPDLPVRPPDLPVGPPDLPDDPPELPSVTTGIEIGHEIGSGSYATVYYGTIADDGTACAVKMFTNVDEHGLPAAFVRELAALRAGVGHRGVIQLLAWSLHPSPSLVMEWADGGTLAEACSEPGDLGRTIGYFLDVACGLHAVYTATGLMHFDIKLQNVLVVGGRACLADFGLATCGGDILHDAPRQQLAFSGWFRPPETFLRRGTALTQAADVWALGAMLYEMVTGVPAFFEVLRPTDYADGAQLSQRDRTRILSGFRGRVARTSREAAAACGDSPWAPWVQDTLAKTLRIRPEDRATVAGLAATARRLLSPLRDRSVLDILRDGGADCTAHASRVEAAAWEDTMLRGLALLRLPHYPSAAFHLFVRLLRHALVVTGESDRAALARLGGASAFAAAKYYGTSSMHEAPNPADVCSAFPEAGAAEVLAAERELVRITPLRAGVEMGSSHVALLVLLDGVGASPDLRTCAHSYLGLVECTYVALAMDGDSRAAAAINLSCGARNMPEEAAVLSRVPAHHEAVVLLRDAISALPRDVMRPRHAICAEALVRE